MTDRIKLAEAMGAKLDYKDRTIDFLWPDGRRQHNFDPENDANDDYAVLEWMLVKTPDASHGRIYLGNKWDYKIGDYARAALKVIDSA